MTSCPIPDLRDDVAAVFATVPAAERVAMLALRQLIFEVAAETDGVGRLEETLKWGQPSYLTPDTRSGTTIRLGTAGADRIAVFTHCQTSVVSDFKELFPDDFSYDGGRGVYLPTGPDMPVDKLRVLIHRALTYHQA